MVRLDVVKLNTANDTCNTLRNARQENFFRGNETDQVRNGRSDEEVTSREVELERRKKFIAVMFTSIKACLWFWVAD